MSGVANGKLLLFGEHSAVYGYPAVGIPLPWHMEVVIADDGEELLPGVFELFPELQGPSTLCLQIMSQIPLGVGFGSSAALCVATVRAICSYLGRNICHSTLWRYAHELEKGYHQHPSGIDTGIALSDSSCCFHRNGDRFFDRQPLPPLAAPIVVGALPREGTTAELIAQVSGCPEKGKYLAHLGRLAERAIASWGDSNELGLLATEAQNSLSALGLSTVDMDRVMNAGNSYGALGGKLSGAGGGGAYYFIAPSFADAGELSKKLKVFLTERGIRSAIEPRCVNLQ